MSRGPVLPVAAFRVDGVPVTQGSMRHVGRGVILHDKSAALTEWRTRISLKAHEAYPHQPIDEPVTIRVDFRIPRPGGHYRKDGELRAGAPPRPATKPDLDKLVRAVGDALCEGPRRIITQDSRIVTWHASKAYAFNAPTGQPGVDIIIWKAEEAP